MAHFMIETNGRNVTITTNYKSFRLLVEVAAMILLLETQTLPAELLDIESDWEQLASHHLSISPEFHYARLRTMAEVIWQALEEIQQRPDLLTDREINLVNEALVSFTAWESTFSELAKKSHALDPTLPRGPWRD